MSRLTIPRWLIVALAATWWVLTPVVDAAYYLAQARRGAYPPGSDSIGIPMSASAFGWLIVTPLVALLVALAAWRAPARVRLTAFDRSRPARLVWSWVWTVALVAFAISEAWFALPSLRDRIWADALHSVAGAVVALALRAALCEVRPAPGTRSTANAT